ncbi:hypothetical protein GQ53DRAFT_532855 [Thozetella sp. PMI_491]|nr:hypothetical protein GQ53DRAFT_532855 [Thozetella sp. PMI_491]
MALRYTATELLHLRQSTLCIKPPTLPPVEDWMGPPPEKTKPVNDRARGGENFPPSQENRRPALDRNGSRNPNPEEIILGPPRTSFASATTARSGRPSDEKAGRDVDRPERGDRFNFRENANDRFRDGRDGRRDFRRRDDQDSDGWSTVKPRKSFGNEGAERFHGRMGGAGAGAGAGGGGGDRFSRGDERRNRDDRDSGERRPRGFDSHSRDKDEDDADPPRRNGLNRNRTDPWFKDNNTSTNTNTNPSGGNNDGAPPSQRERIDRAKNWRERDPERSTNERHNDRHNDRHHDRHNGRWDRDRNERVEREPEWLDEPAEEKASGHTEEDFKKFMESMKASKGGATKTDDKAPATAAVDSSTTKGFFEMDPKVASAPAIEQGPDKFFAAFSGVDAKTSGTVESKDGSKPKASKASRFMALMTPQEDARTKIEPPIPSPAVGPGPSGPIAVGSPQFGIPPPQSSEEKEAFAALIQKLQRQTLGASLQAAAPLPQQPPVNYPEPRAVSAARQRQKSAVASPEPFQQYGGDRRDDPRFQPSLQDMISPRPMGPPVQPPPVSRSEQVLHDLLAQRHQASSQGSNRMDQNAAAAASMNQSQKEFLMGLMQRTESVPRPTEAMVVEAHNAQAIASAQEQARRGVLRLGPGANKQGGAPAIIPDREQAQRQMRGQGPPGLFEDQFHPLPEDRPQPTQILQRPPPPPGLDHHMHSFPMGAGAGNPPHMPPQRPMIPPPGLANNGPRNVPPMPGAMFPPNFPSGGFPPPDAMMMGPPRSMQPPPGFFAGGPPPPGFMPPPGMPGFQPDGAAFGGPPFDRRGMLPPGAGGNFNRQ